MAKKRKGLAAHGFLVPILVVRTPEQHRAIIQPDRQRANPPPLPKVKPPRSRKKRARLLNLGDGSSSLQARVNAMGLRKYTDYLLTPHWLELKRRWKESSYCRGWVCHSLGCDSRAKLSLHHRTYLRLGREELSDLILVCDDCHQSIHRLERRGVPLEEATARVTKLPLRLAA